MEKPADILSIGQEIEAKVVDFNEEDRKISLSMKALQAQQNELARDYDEDVADVDIDAVAAEEEE